jgi:hypothetical protein
MVKQIIKILFLILMCVVFVSSLTFAQSESEDLSNDRPLGWDKGKKEGWNSDVPPGQEKEKKSLKSEANKEDVDNDSGKNRSEEKDRIEKRGLQEESDDALERKKKHKEKEGKYKENRKGKGKSKKRKNQ